VDESGAAAALDDLLDVIAELVVDSFIAEQRRAESAEGEDDD
jgi:hypothetical protein